MALRRNTSGGHHGRPYLEASLRKPTVLKGYLVSQGFQPAAFFQRKSPRRPDAAPPRPLVLRLLSRSCRDYVLAQRAKEKLECTFRPSLNPVTQSIAQAAPLDELVNNRRGQRVRERAQAKAR